MASPGLVSTVTTSSARSEAARRQAPRPVEATEERKRKRKESNRLSAQRSRARKQLQMDELAAQAAALRARNGAMAAAAHEAVRRCAVVQAENELLRARTIELSARLDSLIDLIQCMEAAAPFAGASSNPFAGVGGGGGGVFPQPAVLDEAMYCNYY